MANTKLMKVMEYLINEQEDKARDLLHQIFIEKARAIHEEMLSDDEDMEEMTLGGDMGDHLKDDIEEVEAEEHYNEDVDAEADADVEDAVEDLGDEMDMDMEDMADDEDADDVEVEDEVEMSDDDTDMDDMEDHEHEDEHEEHEEMEDKLHDLEAAIEELKKEFEALQGEEAGEEAHDDHDADKAEDMEESWEDDTDDLEEEYDDLDESVDLDTVAAPKAGEVGSGKFARAEVSTKSPVPPSQKETMGAKPVVTGKGPKASGFDLQSGPDSKEMAGTANRRKKATDGMSAVSKEGDAKALLNKDRSEGFGAGNTRSPIQGKVR